jgi:hypothetical protein
MDRNRLRRIFCFVASLACASHVVRAQVTSGGVVAAPSSVIDFTNAGETIPARKLAADPASCTVGEQYFNTTSNVLKVCTAANTWTAPGGGSVSTVGLATSNNVFTISGSPVTSSGTLTLTPSGTSGGIPYFSGANAMASSAALGVNGVVVGGGAGAAPRATGVTIDASNDLTAPGTLVSGAAATTHGKLALGELLSNGTATVGWEAQDSIATSLSLVFPNATPAANSLMLFPAPTNGQSQWSWIAIPGCLDSGGNHLNFNSATGALACGNTSSGSAQTSITVANAGTTGTTVNTLTKLTGTPSTAVISSAGDIGGAVGIATAGAGATGSVTITYMGVVACVFDGATVAGDYVQISATTAGNCHDTGSLSYPTSGQVIGRVLSTNSSGGTYNLDLFPSEIRASTAPHTFYADLYPDVPTAVDTAVAAGGGTVYLMTPGTYTFTRTINLGNSSKVPVTLICVHGVKLIANITNHSNVLNIFEGSEFFGYGQAHANDSTYNSCEINLPSTARVGDVIANGDQSGGQEDMIVDGVQIVQTTGATVDRGLYHVRGLAAIARHDNIYLNNFTGVGLLVDTPNSSAITPSSVSGNGTTVTATVTASSTDDPDSVFLGPIQSFTVSGCSGGSGTFNGTYTVGTNATVTSATTFTYSATGNGSPTGCTYTPSVSFQGTTGEEEFRTITSIGKSGSTGAIPILVSSISGGSQISDIQFYNINAQSSGPKDFEINGQGGTGTNTSSIIGIHGLHMEAQTNAVTYGLFIEDAHDIHADLVSGAAGTSATNLIYLAQSGSNKTYNIDIESVFNANWPTTINNNINGFSSTQKDITRYEYSGIGNSSAQAGGDYGTNWQPAGAPTTPVQGDIFTPSSGPYANRPQIYTGPVTNNTETFLTGCGLDTTTVCLWDEFFSSSTTSGSIGGLGWVNNAITTAATAAYSNGSYPNLGMVKFTTPATAGDGSVVALNAGTSGPLAAILNQGSWEMTWIFELGTTGNTSFRIGVIGAASAAIDPANGVYLRYDTADSDSTFQFTSANASTETVSSTSVTPSTTTFYKLRIVSNGSGSVTFTLYTGASTVVAGPTSFCPTGCNVTATLNTSTTMTPAIIVASQSGGSGAAANASLDYWGFKASGLNR